MNRLIPFVIFLFLSIALGFGTYYVAVSVHEWEKRRIMDNLIDNVSDELKKKENQ